MFASTFTTASTARTVIGTIGTVFCAGLCLLTATAPAAAAEAPRAQLVSVADLNLAHPQGRNALDARIRQAARTVCDNGSGDLRARAEAARCVRAAIASAAPIKG